MGLTLYCAKYFTTVQHNYTFKLQTCMFMIYIYYINYRSKGLSTEHDTTCRMDVQYNYYKYALVNIYMQTPTPPLLGHSGALTCT